VAPPEEGAAPEAGEPPPPEGDEGTDQPPGP
jgi:hypothetical protein